MTLLITVFAAVITTVIWYLHAEHNQMKLHMLPVMYWGAAMMWLIDAVFEYVRLQVNFFTPSVADMINDAFLGLSVVALGMVIWIVTVLITDPKGVFARMLLRRREHAKQTDSDEDVLQSEKVSE